jgi:hypothetical protein
MRRLVLTGVLAAAALFAQGARAADDAAKERQEAQKEAREAAQATQEQAKEEARETRDQMRDMGTGSGSAEAGQRQARSDREEKKHPMFDGKDNFSVEGKIQKVSKNSITLQREELPPATLSISQHTKVQLDGEQASAQQLKQGQDVKASFNLRGDKAEAVEISAEKMR